MQGSIVSMPSAGGQGAIMGDDGVRYSFTNLGWRDPAVKAVPGMKVDFEVRGAHAIGVYPLEPLPEASPSSRASSEPAPATFQRPPDSTSAAPSTFQPPQVGQGAGAFQPRQPAADYPLRASPPPAAPPPSAPPPSYGQPPSEPPPPERPSGRRWLPAFALVGVVAVVAVGVAVALYFGYIPSSGDDVGLSGESIVADGGASSPSSAPAAALDSQPTPTVQPADATAPTVAATMQAVPTAVFATQPAPTATVAAAVQAVPTALVAAQAAPTAAAAFIGQAADTATPVPTPTAQPTGTPVPTATAQPTNTPTPVPTPTVQPTNTPVPTPTVQPFKIAWQISDDEVQAGESFTLTVRMYDIQQRGEHGGISVSFPSLTESSKACSSKERYASADAFVELLDYTSGEDKVAFYQDGTPVFHKDDGAIPAHHLLVESDDSRWSEGDDRTIQIGVTPRRGGEFPMRIRGWICADGYAGCARQPGSDGTPDQQGFASEKVTVAVSGDVQPTSSEGRIAFVSNRDGNNEIYVMNADGSDQIRLTNNEAADWGPSWSPDGECIAFTSVRHLDHALELDGVVRGAGEIYVINANGSDPTRLKNIEYDSKDEPSWSPDGTHIVFASHYGISVMNADGSNLRRLINLSPYGYLDLLDPVWSPDGTRIAYTNHGYFLGRDSSGGEAFNLEIHVMNADGSNITRLTYNPEGIAGHNMTREELRRHFDKSIDSSPSWSPDGARIVFHSSRDGWPPEIYVMNADGSGQTRLTYNEKSSHSPSWSPDGSRIVFASHYGISVMNADGSDQIRLTNNEAADWDPSWSK